MSRGCARWVLDNREVAGLGLLPFQMEQTAGKAVLQLDLQPEGGGCHRLEMCLIRTVCLHATFGGESNGTHASFLRCNTRHDSGTRQRPDLCRRTNRQRPRKPPQACRKSTRFTRWCRCGQLFPHGFIGSIGTRLSRRDQSKTGQIRTIALHDFPRALPHDDLSRLSPVTRRGPSRKPPAR